MDRLCPKCGMQFEAAWKFCPQCGTASPQKLPPPSVPAEVVKPRLLRSKSSPRPWKALRRTSLRDARRPILIIVGTLLCLTGLGAFLGFP